MLIGYRERVLGRLFMCHEFCAHIPNETGSSYDNIILTLINFKIHEVNFDSCVFSEVYLKHGITTHPPSLLLPLSINFVLYGIRQ